MNPWQQGGGGGYSGNQNVANLFGMMGGDGNPMANLAKSLVASAFQNSPQSQLPTQMMPQPAMRNVGYSAGDRYMSDRRGDFGVSRVSTVHLISKLKTVHQPKLTDRKLSHLLLIEQTII